MEIFRIPTIKPETQNKYQYLGFTRNPFPVVPAVKPLSEDERENGTIFLENLRQDELKEFKDVIINKPNKISLLMDYAAFKGRGIGKTALLNYEKRQINKDLGASISDNEQVLYALYVCPGGEKRERKFWQIAKLIYEAVLHENLLLVVFSRLRFIYGAEVIPEEILAEVTFENMASTIANDKWLNSKNVSFQDLNVNLNRRFKELGIDVRISKDDLIKESFEIFKDNLCPETSDMYWRRSGVDLVFNTLVSIFKEAKLSNCIILFDEAEKIIVSQNFNERREFCENLRYYFIDGSNQNSLQSFFKFLMTVHPYSQELLLPHWNAAGLERFSQLGTDEAKNNTIFFKPLNNDINIAVDLAKAYIDKARIDPSNTSIKPFDEKSLIYALNKSEGIPGKFLKILYNSVEKAVSEGWDNINEIRLESVWKTVSTVEQLKDIPEQGMLEVKKRID